MAGSSYGNIFRITTFGESHGKALGVIADGVPAGLELCEEDIQKWLDRRKPGQSRFTTQRSEKDAVEILSGVFEGKTTGTPIAMMVRNEEQRSADYSNIANVFRPGHADYSFYEKYGIRDYRGGGRSSGRETLSRVAGGAIAGKFLKEVLGIEIVAWVDQIGPVHAETFDKSEIDNNPLRMPDAAAAAAAAAYLDEKRAQKDSSGATVRLSVSGLPAGLGDPVFEKIDANLAKAMLSIGAVKGVEIGDGFAVADSAGSTNNDAFRLDAEGELTKATNHAGGILGGMTDGSELTMRIAFKPTPSIASQQQSVYVNPEDGTLEEGDLEIFGRHDPIIAPRAIPVVEAMAAITIMDALLLNMTSQASKIAEFYKK